MARSDWILPRADVACGRVFHPDRQSAEGHRIGLQFWNQATGRNRERDHLVTFRCRRCGGFHVARRSSKAPVVVETSALAQPLSDAFSEPLSVHDQP
jgi:hypothetical protein